ncbi:hypothetical protein O6H91_05G108100 [Diphasiastrum complanatum]|uniref:Uncharacterized protein n=1 Tax=Diphasiastrum complanatum TaxID=34168 RepID=A0ACC2DS41_DIPCM|nr:hypothetical protein O6H91_05G108100 [Diphasiastrum complanatum]
MSAFEVKSGLHQSVQQEADLKAEEMCKRHSKDNVNLDRKTENFKFLNVDKDMMLEWGQKKRHRNGRLETKAPAAEGSFVLPKKHAKSDECTALADKHVGSVQVQPPVYKRGLALTPCIPCREVACGGGQRNADPSTLVGNVEHGSKCDRDQDLQWNVSIPVEKAKSREALCLQEEHKIATTCNGSASGCGSIAFWAQERAKIEAIWGTPWILENFDLESFEWPKFFMALSRKEKEDDFLAIKGSKLSQRPKRRSKQSEKVLNYVTPGMWLSDLTRERYEVREKKAVKKRRRGLKTMGSVDTDSE